MVDRFEGDPKMTLGPSGSNLVFRGGQPEMDQGLENVVMISLFTKPGWFGNYLFRRPAEKYGSKYEESNEQPITISTLNDNRITAEAALQWLIDEKIVDRVEVRVTNPTGNSKKIFILVSPPLKVLELSNNGINWQLQYLNPANLRID